MYTSVRMACRYENIVRTTLRMRIAEGVNSIKDRTGKIKTFEVIS